MTQIRQGAGAEGSPTTTARRTEGLTDCDKLVAAAPNGNHQQPANPPAGGGTGAAGAGAPGDLPPNLPRNWQEIAPGHLVIAHESLEDGWWEAIVIERDGDMLTLRWRDNPKQAKCIRHRTAVALISTGIDPISASR